MQKKNKETEIYNSDSEVEGKENDKMTQDEEDNKETSVDEDTTKSGTNYHQMYLKASQQRREIEAKAAAA